MLLIFSAYYSLPFLFPVDAAIQFNSNSYAHLYKYWSNMDYKVYTLTALGTEMYTLLCFLS